MYIKSTIDKEIKDCEPLINKLECPEVRARAESSLKWFVRKAVKNKFYFYTLSIISFLAPITVSIAMVFSAERLGLRLFYGIASGIASFSAFLLQLLDVRKKWGIYRNQAEALKSSLALYGLPGHTDITELAEMMEDSMGQTHEKWMRSFNKDV